jgi:hypothetical protein
MGLSNPRIIYGVYSVTPYNRTTGEAYGTAKVVGQASVNLTGELNKLMGGASNYPWAIENGAINSEISLKLKEYPDFLFELFLGKAPTTLAADATGAVTAITNKKGASVVGAPGIASLAITAVTGAAELKFTKYLVKAASPTTVDVYGMSDINFTRGTDKTFENDALKITATPLTITAAGTTDIPGYGLTLTGGAGAIGMTAGDTATFEVKPPSSKSTSVRVGGSSDSFPEFGLIVYAQQGSDGQLVEIDIFRAKGIGLPLGFAEKAFSEAEIKVEAFYDATKNGIFDIRTIHPA